MRKIMRRPRRQTELTCVSYLNRRSSPTQLSCPFHHRNFSTSQPRLRFVKALSIGSITSPRDVITYNRHHFRHTS